MNSIISMQSEVAETGKTKNIDTSQAYSIFIIHGTRRVSLRNLFTKTEPRREWMGLLSASLSERVGLVECYSWSGKLFGAWSNHEIQIRARAIENFLKRASDKVVFISKSNGAQLVENSLSLVSDEYWNQKEFIELRLATPLKGSQIHASRFHCRTICTSPMDNMYKVGKLLFKLLYPTNDYNDSNLINVFFDDLSHSEFNKDIAIRRVRDSHPDSLYELYAKIIISNTEFSMEHYRKM